MSFPSTPPAGGPLRPWRFPSESTATLRSGLTVVAVRMGALPIVHVKWSFRGGRTLEDPSRRGAGRVMSAAMRQGTERWDSAGLARALDHLGARLRTSVSTDGTVVSVTALSSHLDAALDIADEVALRPAFPSDHVARERDKALEVHRHQRTEPDHVAGTWLARAIYGGHPYGDPSATEAGLRAVDREALVDLHRRLADPRRGLLLVVGDVDPEALVARLCARCPEPAAGDGPGVDPPVAGPGPRRVLAVCREGSEQVSIAAGLAVLPRAHPDYLALRVANQVLGAGASSRLFMELRERRSLTYGAYSALDCGRFGGDLTAAVSCAPAKAAEAVECLRGEIARFAREPVGEEELDEARRYVVGSFPRKASGVAGVAALIESRWQYDLPAGIWSSWQAQAAGVTIEAAHAAAARWVLPDRVSFVAVGPREEASEALGGLGEVEVRDASEEVSSAGA